MLVNDEIVKTFICKLHVIYEQAVHLPFPSSQYQKTSVRYILVQILISVRINRRIKLQLA